MSYRCECCRQKVPPGLRCLKHVEYKDDGNIERELKVCASCKRQLEQESLCDVLYAHRQDVRAYEEVIVTVDAPPMERVSLPSQDDAIEGGAGLFVMEPLKKPRPKVKPPSKPDQKNGRKPPRF